MEINPSQNKLMLNNDNCQPNIVIQGEIIGNFRKLLGITYLDRIANIEIVERISSTLTSPFIYILLTDKRRILKW